VYRAFRFAPGFIKTRCIGTGGAGVLRINLIASPIIAISMR
jgi:hypothetical protein